MNDPNAPELTRLEEASLGQRLGAEKKICRSPGLRLIVEMENRVSLGLENI